MLSGQINFFKALERENHKQIDRGKLTVGLIFGVVLLVNAAWIALVVFSNLQKEKEMAAINDYLNAPEVAAALAEDTALNAQRQAAQKDIEVAKALTAYLERAVGFQTGFYDTILQAKPAAVRLTSFSFADNTISLNCATEAAPPPADDFVRALEATGLFESVTYRGFTAGAQGGLATFPIQCKLKEGRGA